MKLTCDRSALVDKLAILARGVSTRSALPVLSGILLQASEGRLDLFSTDMELSIKASLATAIEREGEIVVPARLFTDVVRNLPGGEIVIEAGEAAVKVTAGRAEFSLNAWSASDFPQTSTFDTSEAFAMGREPFVETLTKVGRVSSREAADPHRRAHDHPRRHAEDGGHRQLSAGRQRDEAREGPGDRGPSHRAGESPGRGCPPGGVDGRGRHRSRDQREPGALQARRPGRRRVGRVAAHRRTVPQLQAAVAGLVRP